VVDFDWDARVFLAVIAAVELRIPTHLSLTNGEVGEGGASLRGNSVSSPPFHLGGIDPKKMENNKVDFNSSTDYVGSLRLPKELGDSDNCKAECKRTGLVEAFKVLKKWFEPLVVCESARLRHSLGQEGGKEGLHGSVVPTIGGATHAHPDPHNSRNVA